MRIAFHLGVHCTDDDRLVRTLRHNAETLAEQGVAVPDPNSYRGLIREAANQFERRSAPTPEGFDPAPLWQALDAAGAGRVVLSWENFMAFAAWAVRGRFYRTGGERMRTITSLFPDCEPEFYIALRNPASFLPELHRRQRGRDFAEMMEGVDLTDLRWSDLIVNLRERNPGVPITVWADEDTPLIWPEVLRSVAGIAQRTWLEGEDELLASLMSDEGTTRMHAYFTANPPQSLAGRRRVVSDFLEEYGLDEAFDYAVGVTGWDETLVARLSDSYDRDLAYIATLPGVTMITP